MRLARGGTVHQVSSAPVRHPQHEDVAAVVAGWFTTSAPAIGYSAAETWYGYLCDFGPLGGERVILRLADDALFDTAFQEIRSEASGHGLDIWVDDRTRDEALGPLLLAAGCERLNATTHLALVGEIRASSGPKGLSIEAIGSDALERWAAVKLRAFSDDESPPRPETLAAEMAVRVAEAPIASHCLAHLEGQAVGVIAFYVGADQMVFNLGTRVPFRHRGIAQAVLANWVTDGRREGCRSFLINATEGDRPAELYRRIGFTDEVYWYRRYRLASDS
jgi:ribosomal protein S18 acetylase RimI-like enzyme